MRIGNVSSCGRLKIILSALTKFNLNGKIVSIKVTAITKKAEKKLMAL